jgi:hypothetical protein
MIMSEPDDPGARALVIYESLFGNTATIARAVADGIGEYLPVDVVDSSAAPADVGGYTLVVVGGPTHAFGLTRPSTRQAAVDQGATGPVGPGVREWLAVVRRPPSELVLAGAFDTRIHKRGVPGSAARGMRRRMSRLGFDTSPKAASFWVGATPGPLLAGETDRARQWGATLGRSVWALGRGSVASAG